MRFEFEELGLMSVNEFVELCERVCGQLHIGGELAVKWGNREVHVESHRGELYGYFDSDHANGELSLDKATVAVAAEIETFLRGKGSRPVVRVHAD
jgi:hypothetical protein